MNTIKLSKQDITVTYKKEQINVNEMTQVTIPINLFMKMLKHMPTQTWQERREEFIETLRREIIPKGYQTLLENELVLMDFIAECQEIKSTYDSYLYDI
jgi:hypothetical protein